MRPGIRTIVAGAAISAQALSGAGGVEAAPIPESVTPVMEAAPAPALLGTVRVCVDKDWGAIGPEDFNIAALEQAVGMPNPDNKFTSQSCNYTFDKLIALGRITGQSATGTSTLRFTDKLLVDWLNIGGNAAPSTPATPSAPGATTTPPPSTQEGCPTSVRSMSEVSSACQSAAKAMLVNSGFVDSTVRGVKAFQLEAHISAPGQDGYGTFGPRTYVAAITGSGIATINQEAELKNGIVVDISDQTLKFYSGGKLLVGALASTGKDGFETTIGDWKIIGTRADKDGPEDGWMISSEQPPNTPPAMYRIYYFKATGAGIHGTHAVQKLGTPASLGCVRVAPKVQDTLLAKGMGPGTRVRVQPRKKLHPKFDKPHQPRPRRGRQFAH